MITIPIELSIDKEDIFNSTPEDIESSIKEHIITEIISHIASMLDDEHFIEMTPSKDESTFDIKINILLGSTHDYTSALTETVSNLLELCMNNNISQEDSINIISKATLPLAKIIDKKEQTEDNIE